MILFIPQFAISTFAQIKKTKIPSDFHIINAPIAFSFFKPFCFYLFSFMYIIDFLVLFVFGFIYSVFHVFFCIRFNGHFKLILDGACSYSIIYINHLQ